jgi:hypothetical protein
MLRGWSARAGNADGSAEMTGAPEGARFRCDRSIMVQRSHEKRAYVDARAVIDRPSLMRG